MQRDQAPLFFNAVRWNAVFSAICGALMALGSGWVAGWLGIEAGWILVGIGAGLLLFSLRLYLIERAGEVPRAEAWIIIGGDLAWVIFSAVLLAAYATAFSPLGRILIGATALAVLALAAAKWTGVRRAVQ